MAAAHPASLDPVAVVVVGASAGGVEALRELAARLPADLPASVLVVLHVPSTGTSALPAILDRAGALPARHAVDGDRLRAGEILVAPPDRHLVVLGGHVGLTRGPQENGHRPAIDVLFRTAARTWGENAIGVVLSGSLDDGAAGALALVRRGGQCLAQDFEEALYDSMPRAAVAAAGLDHPLPVAGIVDRLSEWLAAPHSAAPTAPSPTMITETEMAELDPEAMHDHDRPGAPAGYGCPDCGGSLFEIQDGELRRFRCRVGHAWSADSLLARQTVALESALWMALRGLEEKAALNADLGERANQRGQDKAAARFAASATETLQAAELVRRLVADLGGPSDQGTADL